MRVDEIGVPRRPARSLREARKKGRHERPPPGLPAQVSHHAGAVRDSEVPEVGRRDNLHVHTCLSHVLDRIRHEPARRVTGVARERRRQDDDFQSGTSRRPKTTGSARASIVSA